MHKLISLRTFIAGLATTAFLAGCNQTYPKWYYQAQLSGLESHSCKRAMKQSDDNSKMVPDVCEVAISNAIISRSEYQKTDTPPKIQPLEPLDDIKAKAFKAVSQNRYNEAITYFSIAISLEADNKILYYNRGELHFKSEEYEEALADFDKAIAIDPSFVDAHYYRGNSNYDLERYDLAITDFTKVILDYPNDASAFFKRAYSKAELSALVHLSASQCSRRRMRLEKEGIIAGYHARLNHEALGLTLRAVVRVNLNSHNQQNETDFISLVSHHDEITEAFSVSGDADYVLIMQCRDLASFSDFIHHILLPKPMIGQVKSEIALRQIKQPF